MIKPGSTKMIDDSVPAAEAIVCTMLFSWTVASRKPRRRAIEITAAGIEVENVSPALRPKYTFAAVNTNVMMTPIIMPRTVSSARVCSLAFTNDSPYDWVSSKRRRPNFSADQRQRRIWRTCERGQAAVLQSRAKASALEKSRDERYSVARICGRRLSATLVIEPDFHRWNGAFPGGQIFASKIPPQKSERSRAHRRR